MSMQIRGCITLEGLEKLQKFCTFLMSPKSIWFEHLDFGALLAKVDWPPSLICTTQKLDLILSAFVLLGRCHHHSRHDPIDPRGLLLLFKSMIVSHYLERRGSYNSSLCYNLPPWLIRKDQVKGKFLHSFHPSRKSIIQWIEMETKENILSLSS